KSSVVTCGYSLKRLVLNPNIRILIASEKLHIAQKFLSEIKGHISRNDYFRTLYGVMDQKKDDQSWNLSEITVSTRTKNMKEPSISTAGVDVTKVGMHYDLIIVDDPVSQNNITKDQMDKVLNWYKLLLSLLDPGGELIVIGTRWDYGDLYGTLQEEPYRDTFDILIRKAEWEENGTKKYLFPEKLDREFLDETKKIQGVYLFSGQYLNDPVPAEEAEFKQEYFRYYIDADMRSTDLAKYMCVDPAISLSVQADFTVFVVVGVDEKNNLYILHIDRGKYTPSEIVSKFMQKAKLYSTIANGLETNAYQKTLKYQLNDKMRETGDFYNITELKLNQNMQKEMRIRRLQPRYEQGTIFHRRNDLGIAELEYELLHFPRAKHDDVSDALASTLEIIQSPIPRATGKKKKKKRFRSKYTKW
ncbi:MAG: phage terminase large subunit, partial [Candidatus Izemoplasmatales bacterium]|nr:phage terminase large subunit [Candidatus Izemoplasmatales bacterium]